MTRALNLFEAKGPLPVCLGISMVAATVFGFIITIVAIVHGPDDMQNCIAQGGSWAHTLTQPEGHDNLAHWTDTCTMPGGK